MNAKQFKYVYAVNPNYNLKQQAQLKAISQKNQQVNETRDLNYVSAINYNLKQKSISREQFMQYQQQQNQ